MGRFLTVQHPSDLLIPLALALVHSQHVHENVKLRKRKLRLFNPHSQTYIKLTERFPTCDAVYQESRLGRRTASAKKL